MHNFRRISCVLFSLVFLGGFFLCPANATERIEIWRDGAGVPHIVAKSLDGAYWGYGYCLGKDRLFQLDLLRRSVKGRLAEVFGKTFTDADFIARRDGIPLTELEKGLSEAPADFRGALKAFTAGINHAVFLTRTGEFPLDPAFAATSLTPGPFTELDMLEIFAGTMAVRFNDFTQELDNLHLLGSLVQKFGAKRASRLFEDVMFFRDPRTYTTLGPKPQFPVQFPRIPQTPLFHGDTEGRHSPALRNRKKSQLLNSIGLPTKSGSYAVALSNRPAGKEEAFLLGGPQMGYFKPSALYEVGLHTPQFDLVGTTPVGYVVILFGANHRIAFTATAGVANLVDIVALEKDPGNPDMLRNRDFSVARATRTETFLIKGEPKPVEKQVTTTPIGPVIAEEHSVQYVKTRGWQNHVIDSYAAWYSSNHARNLDEWLAAGDGMALSINWLAGDTRGHIAYTYCGVGKTRKSFGDDRLPARQPPRFPYPDVRISGVDPVTGFFANWNSPPYDSFRNGDLQIGWGADQRTAFLAHHIEANRGSWSAEFLKALDQKVAFADQRAFFFREAILGKIEGGNLPPLGRKALEILKEWDGTRNDANGDGLFDHAGAGLFDAFWSKLFPAVFAESLGEFLWMIGSDPTWTQTSILYSVLKGTTGYDFLGGKPAEELVTRVFIETVQGLASEGRPIPCLPCPPMDFGGVNHVGAPTQTATASFSPLMNRGSDVQIVSLNPEEIRIWGVLPPGNASRGPHESDQLQEFKKFRYRQRPLTMRQLELLGERERSLDIP